MELKLFCAAMYIGHDVVQVNNKHMVSWQEMQAACCIDIQLHSNAILATY